MTTAVIRAEQAAKKTAERLRKAKLADATIRLRAATKRADKLTDRMFNLQMEREDSNTEVAALEAEVKGLVEVGA